MIDSAELDGLPEMLRRDAMKVISQAATQIPNVIKPRSPVRTGHLRRSWKTRHSAYQAVIRNTAFYSGYVEHGTSKMGARPMLTPLLPLIETELARSFNTGTDFYLQGGYFKDPTDQLREAYQKKYSGYGSGRSFSG